MPQQKWKVPVEQQVKSKGDDLRFQSIERMKGFDPGKSPLKDKPIYLVLYRPFSHYCLDYYRSLDLLFGKYLSEKQQKQERKLKN